MESIIYVGIDVHKNSYTLCCLEPSMYGEDKLFAQTTLDPDSHLIEKYLDRIEENFLLQHPDKDEVRFVCGYEAGCMGYTLYYQLRQKGITCHVMAPSSMPRYQKHRIKTDRLDAEKIAKSLAYGTYSLVYIPSVQDDMVKQYIRMRDDHKKKFKMLKQEIQGLCLRNGQAYDAHKSYWTAAHLTWLSRLSLDPILKETLQEYLSSYRQLSDKLDAFDRRIEEFAQLDAYREKVEQLRCFVGIKTYSAMTILVETSDFQRFRTAAHYAAYLGLVPGEHSSGDTQIRTSITKAGNTHIRRVLVEAAQCYTRGSIGQKSRDLRKRQEGKAPDVIAYADRASERLKRKFYRMKRQSKKHNVAVTAIARELAGFVWGMMTEHREPVQAPAR